MKQNLLSLNLNIHQRTPSESLDKEKPSYDYVLQQDLFAVDKLEQFLIIQDLLVIQSANLLQNLEFFKALKMLLVQ